MSDAGAEPGTEAGAMAEDAAEDSQPGAADPGAELADMRAQLAEAQDQRLRALADLDNFRKRSAVQVSRAAEDARAAVAAEWLPVVDNLERALEHSQADSDAIIAGVQAVRDQAVAVLAGLGFPRQDDLGTTFDPSRHEAVAVLTDPDVAEGTVIGVVRAGYGDGEHQLRPAQVVVAKAD